LYNENNRPIRSAFNAALASRFPVGSSLKALTEFMISLNGTCSRSTDENYFRCEAAIEPCANTVLSNVEASGDVITKIKTLELALTTCN